MYRILWYSPYALHDRSSGAAIQCRSMLEYVRRCYAAEVEIAALCALVFDDPQGSHFFAGQPAAQTAVGTFFSFRDQDIQYHYLRTPSGRDRELSAGDKRPLLGKYLELLRHFRPDLLIGYGDDPLFRAIYADAAARGIPGVYCVCNPNYRTSAFPHCWRIITDSQATAAYYARVSGINIVAVGTFIDPKLVVASSPAAARQQVTFINPSFNKGLSLFAALALLAGTQLPEVRFLVVQNRGSWAENLARLHVRRADGSYAAAALHPGLFANVELVGHADDVREIYARTRVLVMPSLWFECWGRTASEAVMNGIPVLCSRSGGLPEAAGAEFGAAICLEAPPECRRDYQLLPEPAWMQPWLAALGELLAQDRSAACARAAAQHDPRRAARRVWEVLQPLLQRRAGWGPRLLRSGLLAR